MLSHKIYFWLTKLNGFMPHRTENVLICSPKFNTSEGLTRSLHD